MAYSCFEQIPLSREYYQNQLIDELKLIAETAGKKNKATSRLKKKQEAVSKALSELSVATDDLYNGVYFDDLGITRLFVDEAHNFKNVPIETKTDKVPGINAEGSKKCRDMMDKVHMVQKMNDGAGVVFATGTPITNSITDAFIMQKYLQSGELAMMDLQNFDSRIGMFAGKKRNLKLMWIPAAIGLPPVSPNSTIFPSSHLCCPLLPIFIKQTHLPVFRRLTAITMRGFPEQRNLRIILRRFHKGPRMFATDVSAAVTTIC